MDRHSIELLDRRLAFSSGDDHRDVDTSLHEMFPYCPRAHAEAAVSAPREELGGYQADGEIHNDILRLK